MISFVEFAPAWSIPLFIFLARILDVSLGTLRIMFVSKGLKVKAALLGFVEILIWIVIVAQVFQNLDNWLNYAAYAGGFATGTFIGMVIEEKMKMGIQIFRIIVDKGNGLLSEKLMEADFRLTVVNAEGKFGPVKILFTVAKRKRSTELVKIVGKYAPNAFYSVEDVKHISTIDKELSPHRQDILTRMLKLKKSI